MKGARLLVVLLAGCTLGRPDRERLGDIAWHEARWTDAIANYRSAGDSPRLTAKLADTQLQAGLLAESAQAWTRLGTEAPERAGEAAAGLARVAGIAGRDGRQGAIAMAIVGLRRVAPAWPVGRIAGDLGRTGDLEPGQLADLVVSLLAATPDRAAADPLLLTLGRADRARGACELAVPLLETVLRRNANPGLRDSAATTLGWCELGLGLAALQADRPGDAERWLDRAAAGDPAGAVGRRALLGFGDARARQGDSVAARTAWRTVATANTSPDSLTQLALLRLAEIVPAVGSDTTIPHPVRP